MNDITTSEIIEKGYKCLFEQLGTIETERFISVVIRERFDYTRWRRQYFDDMPLDELLSAAAEYESSHPFGE